MSDGFLKPILAVIDVPDVDFQSRKAPLVIEAREYSSGAFCGLKRLIVFTQQNQWLDGSTQSARSLLPIAQ
jgi:hypothetical protein